MAESILLPGMGVSGRIQVQQVHRNLPIPQLYEEVIRRGEGRTSLTGALVVNTGIHTGRSPEDKLIVRDPNSEANIDWGKINLPCEPKQFDFLFERLLHYLSSKEVYVQDCWVGASPRYSCPVQVITELAWHSLFSRNLFLGRFGKDLKLPPEYTVINVPGFEADPARDGTKSGTFILVHLARKLILIGGSSYAGEIKKSLFTVMNYQLPLAGILSMHCSANVGEKGDVALFFGLSGTGKTTLSTDPERRLIGDDEHGWSQEGVFNFEGGCYAKAIRLSSISEPEIHGCARRFGTVLENVVMDGETRELNFDDASITENTRAAYPLEYVKNAVIPGVGDHPVNLVMLTCDAFGVLPPIARLTGDQAMYHFLSGYTAKVAGTEKGLGRDPVVTFSACFGAPFMALRPTVYAGLLGEKIAKHQVNCWLVNTGWSGGGVGVGRRIELGYSRAMVHAALQGKLDHDAGSVDPWFKIFVPERCEGVPQKILRPQGAWPDPAAYEQKARHLATLFQKNFDQFTGIVPRRIGDAGPNAD
ncbi:MAG: phosphoenolpyruvate carboxykinase (ATP) [Terriglobia bacterium]